MGTSESPKSSKPLSGEQIAQLEKVAHLRELGAVTEDEFEILKQNILGLKPSEVLEVSKSSERDSQSEVVESTEPDDEKDVSLQSPETEIFLGHEEPREEIPSSEDRNPNSTTIARVILACLSIFLLGVVGNNVFGGEEELFGSKEEDSSNSVDPAQDQTTVATTSPPTSRPTTTTQPEVILDVREIRNRLSVGSYHACLIQPDSTATCWGAEDFDGTLTPAPEVPLKSVSAGYGSTCGIRLDSSIICWGADNFHGELDAPSGAFTSVDVGYLTSCALTVDSTAVCWGDNEAGQARPPSIKFTQITVGNFHACGLEESGTVSCWGSDTEGKTTPPNAIFRSISSGDDFTCGLQSNGKVTCWGRDLRGRMSFPEGQFSSVSSGPGGASCAVRLDGTIACWGEPILQPPTGKFLHVSVGQDHACAVVRTSGNIRCWGSDQVSQVSGAMGLAIESLGNPRVVSDTAFPTTTRPIVVPPTTFVEQPVSAVMPFVPCGTDLQAAQNMIQSAGVFFSSSQDATGQGRRQILDRNWTVVEAFPEPGTPIGEGDVLFYVVKDEEFVGC